MQVLALKPKSSSLIALIKMSESSVGSKLSFKSVLKFISTSIYVRLIEPLVGLEGSFV
jgi:hypothetical protein